MSPTYPQTVSLCASVAHRTGAVSAQIYTQQLRDAIGDITKTAKLQRLAAALPVFGAMLRCLKLAAPALHRKHLLDLIEASGTVFELFKLVERASPRLRLSNRTLPILRGPSWQ